jgi:hypothetical protein
MPMAEVHPGADFRVSPCNALQGLTHVYELVRPVSQRLVVTSMGRHSR